LIDRLTALCWTINRAAPEQGRARGNGELFPVFANLRALNSGSAHGLGPRPLSPQQIAKAWENRLLADGGVENGKFAPRLDLRTRSLKPSAFWTQVALILRESMGHQPGAGNVYNRVTIDLPPPMTTMDILLSPRCGPAPRGINALLKSLSGLPLEPPAAAQPCPDLPSAGQTGSVITGACLP